MDSYTVFNWTIRGNEGADELANHPGYGTLDAARDAARDHNVRITLTDEQGFARYRVSPDGYEIA